MKQRFNWLFSVIAGAFLLILSGCSLVGEHIGDNLKGAAIEYCDKTPGAERAQVRDGFNRSLESEGISALICCPVDTDPRCPITN